METMTGLDAKFLYSETPTAHMHTVKVVVADVSALKGEFSYDALTGILADQLCRLPPFRRRVVPVPWGLGHPVWVEDPRFDLKRHISRRTLAGPAGDRELASVVAEFAGTPLARDRPLWEVVGCGWPRRRPHRGRGEDPPCGRRRVRRGGPAAERGARRRCRAVKGTQCGYMASRAAPNASRSARGWRHTTMSAAGKACRGLWCNRRDGAERRKRGVAASRSSRLFLSTTYPRRRSTCRSPRSARSQ